MKTHELYLTCCYFQGFMILTCVLMLYELGTFEMQFDTGFLDPTLRLMDKPLPSAIYECKDDALGEPWLRSSDESTAFCFQDVQKASDTKSAYRIYDTTRVKDGLCEGAAMKKCNSGFCIQEGLECPITDIVLSDKNNDAQYKYLEFEGKYLGYKNDGTGMPIVEAMMIENPTVVKNATLTMVGELDDVRSIWVQTIPIKESCQESLPTVFDDFRNQVLSFTSFMMNVYKPVLMIISGLKTISFMWSFIEVAKAIQVHGEGKTTMVFNVGFTIIFIVLHTAHEFFFAPFHTYMKYLSEDFIEDIYVKQVACSSMRIDSKATVNYVITKTGESVQVTQFTNYISIVLFICTLIGCAVVTVLTKMENKKLEQIELEERDKRMEALKAEGKL